MASNVLSPDQGGWKFWAGCGSSKPRLQPPGTFPGPRLRPRCPGALLRQGPRATTCPWPQGPPGPGHTAGTSACWPQELRLHPWVFLAFFPAFLSVLFTLLPLLCFSQFSAALFAAFPLPCSHFLSHYPRSPFHLHFSFSFSPCSAPAARPPSPPGAAPARQGGLCPAPRSSPEGPRRAQLCHVPRGPPSLPPSPGARSAAEPPPPFEVRAEGREGQRRGGGSGAGGSGGGGTGRARPSGPTAALRLSAAGAPGVPSRPPPLPSGMF